ncbi:4520_t:CDS:2 [Ambispora leptoticha]|uniref:5-formyltetrahydrofolate cyclo-ligase n=1 Tax=Ambispora leptoticha TaxID=144679 RepID=A0A9N9AJN7_9GLOM|nr:4520_t:CDS:2 [Ambispora leptoticha]
MSSVRSLKAAFRKEMRHLLGDISQEVIERESMTLFTLPLFQDLTKDLHQKYINGQNISIYVSMSKGEIQTKSIIQDIFSKGKLCYVPRWNGDIMDMVRLYSYEDFLSLPLNRWNIPEPKHDEEREIATQLDLIIMPGLAFDLFGNRLGHGKGYYDRYLSKCKNNSVKPPRTIALALDSQITKDKIIPTTDFDQKPDLIVSSGQIISSSIEHEK